MRKIKVKRSDWNRMLGEADTESSAELDKRTLEDAVRLLLDAKVQVASASEIIKQSGYKPDSVDKVYSLLDKAVTEIKSQELARSGSGVVGMHGIRD